MQILMKVDGATAALSPQICPVIVLVASCIHSRRVGFLKRVLSVDKVRHDTHFPFENLIVVYSITLEERSRWMFLWNLVLLALIVLKQKGKTTSRESREHKITNTRRQRVQYAQ
jgi:hypothetical protein